MIFIWKWSAFPFGSFCLFGTFLVWMAPSRSSILILLKGNGIIKARRNLFLPHLGLNNFVYKYFPFLSSHLIENYYCKVFLILGKEEGAIEAELEAKVDIGNIHAIGFESATIRFRFNKKLKNTLKHVFNCIKQCNRNILEY